MRAYVNNLHFPHKIKKSSCLFARRVFVLWRLPSFLSSQTLSSDSNLFYMCTRFVKRVWTHFALPRPFHDNKLRNNVACHRVIGKERVLKRRDIVEKCIKQKQQKQTNRRKRNILSIKCQTVSPGLHFTIILFCFFIHFIFVFDFFLHKQQPLKRIINCYQTVFTVFFGDFSSQQQQQINLNTVELLSCVDSSRGFQPSVSNEYISVQTQNFINRIIFANAKQVY